MSTREKTEPNLRTPPSHRARLFSTSVLDGHGFYPLKVAGTTMTDGQLGAMRDRYPAKEAGVRFEDFALRSESASTDWVVITE
jgi:hypothetical protein